MSTSHLDSRGLKSSAVAEGESPRFLGDGGSVDGIEVDGCLLFALATRQEADTGHRSWDGAGQRQCSRLRRV